MKLNKTITLSEVEFKEVLLMYIRENQIDCKKVENISFYNGSVKYNLLYSQVLINVS